MSRYSRGRNPFHILELPTVSGFGFWKRISLFDFQFRTQLSGQRCSHVFFLFFPLFVWLWVLSFAALHCFLSLHPCIYLFVLPCTHPSPITSPPVLRPSPFLRHCLKKEAQQRSTCCPCAPKPPPSSHFLVLSIIVLRGKSIPTQTMAVKCELEICYYV